MSLCASPRGAKRGIVSQRRGAGRGIVALSLPSGLHSLSFSGRLMEGVVAEPTREDVVMWGLAAIVGLGKGVADRLMYVRNAMSLRKFV